VLARVVVALVAGAVGVVAVGAFGSWLYAPPVGWSLAAAVFLVWTWAVIGRMNPQETASHATREDPTRHFAHVLVVVASLASLLGVGYLLVATSGSNGNADLAAALGALSVIASWLLVHTVFTLRYGRIYYSEPAPAVDFNQSEPPAYAELAYLAFTIGMTYQVSDTDLRTRRIRATALSQALISYLLGAVVLAVTINLVASLGSSGH
jgi:uncharacterized membrane protein